MLSVLHEQLLNKFFEGSKCASVWNQMGAAEPLLSQEQRAMLIRSTTKQLIEAGN